MRISDWSSDVCSSYLYAYDNILFGVAQQVIEAASGMSYEQFLRTRIFGPLGMSETRFNADYLKPGDNVATGLAKFDFKDLRPVAPLTWSNVAGAGGIYSSVHAIGRASCRERVCQYVEI